MKRIRCRIVGKVQGVWFRAWTLDTATRLGLAGWVRNMPNGDVQAEAQGEIDDLEQFIRELHDGPPLARVSAVEIDWIETSSEGPNFSILR